MQVYSIAFGLGWTLVARHHRLPLTQAISITYGFWRESSSRHALRTGSSWRRPNAGFHWVSLDVAQAGLTFKFADLRVHSEQRAHLFVQKSLSWTVGLHPFSVDDELRNRSFTGVPDHVLRGFWSGLDIDFLVADLMFIEEALGYAAVAAPWGRVKDQFHT